MVRPCASFVFRKKILCCNVTTFVELKFTVHLHTSSHIEFSDLIDCYDPQKKTSTIYITHLVDDELAEKNLEWSTRIQIHTYLF